MKKEYLINDIWIINYSVPYKNKDKLFRPFIITDIINNVIYGISLTSFRDDRYKPDLGDIIIKINSSETQSIIKPYQITNLKEKFFIRKIDIVSSEIIKDINQKIDNNAREYLSMKNTNSILREFIIEEKTQIIEQQSEKITDLKFKNEQLKLELELTKSQLLAQEQDLELE